ncbi:oxygenase MpaB family protein [Amycolatopsis sp. NPDC058986]|uniref:oxygenase MpaB family protein n=1 Tax=unclassified Amycolatopsis TaxID=2618356 RepID=UPI00366D0559
MPTTEPRTPTAFRAGQARERGPHARIRRVVKALTGTDLFPSPAITDAFAAGLSTGDPIAERFVRETYHGGLGARKSRELLERALTSSIDDVPEAPESMRALFEDFERLPGWVDPGLVEEGAAVWRRWGYALGAVGNAGTMDTYTEAALALPLSLSGGYAGSRALHRYLETTHWWIEVCRPGAILTPGSLAREISLKVRVMHVSVRARVAEHPEWERERWGLPISQSHMLLTLLGGSIAPAFALHVVGHVTTPREMRAVLHFNRYCGHLAGVRADGYFPETALEAWRILFLCDAARAHDSGALGRELVESFVPSFAPLPRHRGFQKLRAAYHFRVQAGYSGLFMLPWHRRRYRMPSPLPGIVFLLLRAPLILTLELLRRLSPRVDRWWQTWSLRGWDRWYRWQSAGRAAEFDAARELRR